jgi:hypothetical protein
MLDAIMWIINIKAWPSLVNSASTYTLRPKIFGPFDFYRARLTIRLIKKIVQM